MVAWLMLLSHAAWIQVDLPRGATTAPVAAEHASLPVAQDAPAAMLAGIAQPPGTLPPPVPPTQESDGWIFEETFDGDPPAPSQDLLPRSFDYAVTHRTHPAVHFDSFAPFPADHGDDCAGPDPAVSPLPQHGVVTSHLSNGTHPDASFFICKNHMMSSMGDVEGYSVTAFWPKQEFDFADGGVLEFDVNINDDHARSWWEILIAPRRELKVGAAVEWLPIDETYPRDRIVLGYSDSKRMIHVGAGAIDPEGGLVRKTEALAWGTTHPTDPANSDRRIRRTMRITLAAEQIVWAIQQADGTFDEFSAAVPGGLPFTRGLVLFKTHAYTPKKDGNRNNYTFHWDNIRFDGPYVGEYENFEADDVVYLQTNGSRPIGASQTVAIELPYVGKNPVLFGQVNSPLRGQVLLSVNGGDDFAVHPYEYTTHDCSSSGWKSFQLALDPVLLQAGTNQLTWTIGPRPDCALAWLWDGFSIKNLELQFDLFDPPPTPQPVPTATTAAPTAPAPTATPVSLATSTPPVAGAPIRTLYIPMLLTR